MKRTKLLGIEFCRGLATYAVVVLHSGDASWWGIPVYPSAAIFQQLFKFAVPFFLAASFYFIAAKPSNCISSKFWQSRFERLVVPYLIWSSIFFLSRIIIFSASNKSDRLNELLQDPLAIVFLGGASYHLYFLPLLFSGTALVFLFPFINKISSTSKSSLIFLSIITIFIYHFLLASGNGFQLSTGIAFSSLLESSGINPEQHPFLRLILVQFAWAIRCLPYFLISLSIHRYYDSISNFVGASATVAWAFAFIFFDVFGELFLPGVFRELLLAYIMLCFALSLSEHLLLEAKFSSPINNLGVCSFGIYLIHPYILNCLKPIISNVASFDGISIFSILLLSIPSFLLSWLVVFCLSKSKLIAKYAFGAR